MLALLKLIPLKDYIYGSAIVALLIGFGVYTAHERGIGKAAEVALVTKAAAVQAALATEKTQHGLDNATQAEKLFVSVDSLPAPADAPHLIVRQCTAIRATVPAASGAGVSVPAADSSVEHPQGVDIGPGLDVIGRDGDAEVAYLQTLLKSCISIGACKATP